LRFRLFNRTASTGRRNNCTRVRASCASALSINVMFRHIADFLVVKDALKLTWLDRYWRRNTYRYTCRSLVVGERVRTEASWTGRVVLCSDICDEDNVTS